MLWKKYNKNAKYEVGSYEDQNLRHNELTIDPYANQATEEASYERYDKLIAKMALPDYEYETLLAMMNGMRMIDMKRYFNVDYRKDLWKNKRFSLTQKGFILTFLLFYGII